MDEQEFRKQLTLKPVEEEHIDQFNELLSYVFQVTEADIEESGFENKRAFIKSKQPILELSKVFGLVSRKSINFTNCYLSMRSQYPWRFV